MKTYFIQLTSYPDNSLVLVNPSHIQAITTNKDSTYIYLVNMGILVKETPVQIQGKIQ